jgi:hypothetical protein
VVDIILVKERTLSIIDVKDSFFEDLRNDYPDFDKWFNLKVKEK